ncbi:hypothetical protein Mapa_003954 [Marchantia paleacea]|nr:hypothetical protein Mapa_003954 [Marchantia paleacea]
MLTISIPFCRSVSCSQSASSVPSVNLAKSRITSSASCRAAVSLDSKNGQNLEEKSRGASTGRRLFVSMMSGTVLLNCLEKTSAAAEEVNSDSVAAESFAPQVTPPELALPDLTAVEGAAAEVPATSDATAPAGNALIQKLLARSKANKEKNDKARLDDYYRRNYKEYFEFVEGTIRNKKKEELTEAEKGIIEWLAKNK